MADSQNPPSSMQPPPIATELRELAKNKSGVDFIYSALDLFAARYALRDAVVVLASRSFGTQIFRLNRRTVDPNWFGELGMNPGVHCVPDTVPKEERDALFSACASQFALRSNADHTSDPGGDADERHRPFGFVNSLRRRRSNERSTPNGRLQGPFLERTGPSRGVFARELIARVLALVDIAAFALTVTGVHGPVRLVLGLVLGIVIPGWCVVAPLRLENPPLEIGLTLAVSLSLLMLVAQILITIRQWHLVALEEVTCVVCFPVLLYLAKSSRPIGRHSR